MRSLPCPVVLVREVTSLTVIKIPVVDLDFDSAPTILYLVELSVLSASRCQS